MSDVDSTKQHYTIDKRVPVAVILTLLVNFAGTIWFASALNSRVNTLEDRTSRVAEQGDRLIRVETRVEAVQTGIMEIKNLLRDMEAPPARFAPPPPR